MFKPLLIDHHLQSTEIMKFNFHSRDGLTNFLVPQRSNVSCCNVITVAWIVITMLLRYRLICWLQHIMVPLWHCPLCVSVCVNSLKAVRQTLSVF